MRKWISEQLLSLKIEELESKESKDELDQVLLSQCQRELEVLKRLRIEELDLSGDLEVVKERLEGNSVYLMKKEEFDHMSQKALMYDSISRMLEGCVNGGDIIKSGSISTEALSVEYPKTSRLEAEEGRMITSVSDGSRGTRIVTEKDSVTYTLEEGPEPKEAEYSEVIVAKGGAYGESTEESTE